MVQDPLVWKLLWSHATNPLSQIRLRVDSLIRFLLGLYWNPELSSPPPQWWYCTAIRLSPRFIANVDDISLLLCCRLWMESCFTTIAQTFFTPNFPKETSHTPSLLLLGYFTVILTVRRPSFRSRVLTSISMLSDVHVLPGNRLHHSKHVLLITSLYTCFNVSKIFF
jgi:hypothetical protein